MTTSEYNTLKSSIKKSFGNFKHFVYKVGDKVTIIILIPRDTKRFYKNSLQNVRMAKNRLFNKLKHIFSNTFLKLDNVIFTYNEKKFQQVCLHT